MLKLVELAGYFEKHDEILCKNMQTRISKICL